MTGRPIKPARIAPKIDIRPDTLVPREVLRDPRITTFTNSNPFLGARDSNIGDLYRGDSNIGDLYRGNNPDALLPSDTNPAGNDILTKVADDYVRSIHVAPGHQDIAAIVKNATDLIAQAMEMKNGVSVLHLISSGLNLIMPQSPLFTAARTALSGASIIGNGRGKKETLSLDALLAREPGSSDEAKGDKKTRKKAKKSSPRLKKQFAPSAKLLRSGIHTLKDLPAAFELLSKIHPRWKAMVDTMERLRQERIDRGETAFMGEAFAIIVPGDGTYAIGSKDRKTELGGGISLRAGDSVFALLHELTHALPLTELPTELASMPYEELMLLEDSASFEAIFHNLLNHMYQNEAISALAEIVLYRDMKDLDIPDTALGHREEVKWLKKALKIYKQEGLAGFLRSEIYIGRNHRSSYNRHRLLAASLLAVYDSQVLNDPSLGNVLGEYGVEIEDQGPLQKGLKKVQAFLDDPLNPKAAMELIEGLKAEGLKIKLDVPAIIKHAQEAAALISGKQQKASVSFLGRREETVHRVGILAEVRRRFESYLDKIDDVEDLDGLLSLYWLALRLSIDAAGSERKGLLETAGRVGERLIEAFVKQRKPETKAGEEHAKTSIESALDLERGRIFRDKKLINNGLKGLLGNFSFEFPVEHGERGIAHRPYNIPFHILSQAITDPLIQQITDTNKIVKAMKTALSDTTSPKFAWIDFTWTNLEDIGGEDGYLPTPVGLHAGERGSFDEFLIVSATLDDGGILPTVLKTDREDGEYHVNRSIIYALQIATAFPGPRVNKFLVEIHADVISADGASPTFTNRDLPKVIAYQQLLKLIRRGKSVDIRAAFKTNTETLDARTPTLFWLGEGAWAIPEAVPLFPDNATLSLPTAVIANRPLNLGYYHLLLEKLERQGMEHALPERVKDAVLVDLNHTAEITFNLEALGTDLDGNPLSLEERDPGLVWTIFRLAIRWAKLGVERGSAEWSETLLRGLLALIDDSEMEAGGTLPHIFRLGKSTIEASLSFFPVWGAKTPVGRLEELEKIADEYETTVRLRREGLKPADIAELVTSLEPESILRPPINKLIRLAIDHTASFDPRSHQFRGGLKGIIAAIHASHLLHSEKDELLEHLFKTVIPDKTRLSEITGMSAYRKLEIFDWLQNTLLSSEMLNSVGLYPRAEAVLLQRSRQILREIGAAYIPIEIEGRVLEVAERLYQFMRRLHPEVVSRENIERLQRVSPDLRYQSDLGDIFPELRPAIDPSIPISRWNPLAIRRGLVKPAAIWERVTEEFDSQLSDPGEPDAEFGYLLEILEALSLHEVQQAVAHGDIDTEIKGLFETYKRRSEEMQEGDIKKTIATTLSLYASAERVLARLERARLSVLTALSSILWGLELAEGVLNEGRPFTPREEGALLSILSAPTVSDAKRKRELFLAMISEERLPIAIRRRSALGLAQASESGETLEYLIDGYEMARDKDGEARLYRLIAEYWKRFGTLPDDISLILINDESRRDEAGFWKRFDRALTEKREAFTPLGLELTAINHGRHAQRFLDETLDYIDGKPLDLLVFREELQDLFPQAPDKRSELRPMVKETLRNRKARLESLRIVQMRLPEAFLKQPPEIRFLLLSFLENMPRLQVESLVREMRKLGERGSDAEVFNHFFLHTGLAKAGQFLSTMVGIVPDADRAVYAKLQDRIPASSTAEVRRTVEAELGRPLHEVFSEWDDIPVASASMGEVYQARLLDGTDVYVKVTPPSKEAQIRTAIETLLKVAEAWEDNKERFTTPFDIAKQINAFVRQLQDQLNFMKEFKQAASIRHEGILTPEYLKDLKTEHLLVMLPVPGTKVTELVNEAERKKAAEAYSLQALKKLFIAGEYHADPHPGNVFWDADAGQLTWLDWGVVGELSNTKQENIAELLFAMAIDDKDIIMSGLESLAMPGLEYDASAVRSRLYELDEIVDPADKLARLLTISGENGLYLETDVMKAIAFLLTVSGVVRDLDPDRNFSADVVKIYLQRTEEGEEDE